MSAGERRHNREALPGGRRKLLGEVLRGQRARRSLSESCYGLVDHHIRHPESKCQSPLWRAASPVPPHESDRLTTSEDGSWVALLRWSHECR